MNAQVPPELRELLEALLEKPGTSVEPVPQVQRFKLTLLKKISQSTKPSKIRATLDDWQTLRTLHDELAPVIASLDLTHEGLRYYANAVIKTRVFQVSRRVDDDRHLHLVCFIAHQFYRLQDTLIDILLTVVQNALNACTRHHKDQYYAARMVQRRTVRAFVGCVDYGGFQPFERDRGNCLQCGVLRYREGATYPRGTDGRQPATPRGSGTTPLLSDAGTA